MIDIKSLSAEWIAEKRNKYSKDPNLMESMIYALYLLEQLQLTGLDFIFKGGTSLILLTDDEKAKYGEINIGINQFRHFVFLGSFDILEAQVASAKAAYLAAIIFTDHKEVLTKFSKEIPLADYLITNPDYNYLNKRLKFVAEGEALFYWYHTINLLYPTNE